MDDDAEFSCPLQKLIDQIRVETLKRPRTPMKDRDLGPGARRDVRELKRDVSAADEDEPPRQIFERQKLVATGHKLFALNIQLRRPGSGRDQ